MQELIKIESGEEGNQTVNARELHSFLQAGSEFRHWIKDRIEQYGFADGIDFTTSEKIVRGGKAIEYHITIDMAKELAMVERNEKGKQARQYFIECERQAMIGIDGAAKQKRVRHNSNANRLADAKAIDFIGNMVAKVPGARADVVAAIKLNMMEECIGIPVTQFRIALPSTPIEKMVRLNPTQIGERIGSKSNIKISAQRVNQCLLLLGLQRKSESGWVITEMGAKYGESRPFQASNKHVGDQIDWHESIIEVVESELAKAPLSVVKLSVATQSAQGALV